MHHRSKPQRGTPEGIIARLYALADLAEQAAHGMWIVRVFVLWILRRAETVAIDYVFDKTWRAGLDELTDQLAQFLAEDGDEEASALEALRLAYIFRALAMVLSHLVANGYVKSSENRYLDWESHPISARSRLHSRGRFDFGAFCSHLPSGRPEVRLAQAGFS